VGSGRKRLKKLNALDEQLIQRKRLYSSLVTMGIQVAKGNNKHSIRGREREKSFISNPLDTFSAHGHRKK
jgi:TfoX/Sxy family transcriptional regulator of competence genes